MQDTRRPAALARPVRPVASTGQTGQAQRRHRTFKPKHSEVGTLKVNESKVQRKLEKHKLTFDQLLNKYTNVVLKDRPLKKGHLHVKASVLLLRENSPSVGVIALQRSLLRRGMVLLRGRHRHRVFLIMPRNMKDFGCIVIRCYTHHLTEGRRIT